MLSNVFNQVLENLLEHLKSHYSFMLVDKLLDILVAMDQQGLCIVERINELASQVQENQELNKPLVKLAAYLPKISYVNVLSYLGLSKQSSTMQQI